MGASSSTQRFPMLMPFFNEDEEPPRILVLGCMGSGKTTLCRQLNRQTRSQTPVLEYYSHNLQYNVLSVWRALKHVCDELKVDYSNWENDFSVLYEFKHREKLSDKVVASLLSISRSHLLEECQRKKRTLPMPYNYKYFVQHTNRMIADGYVPTETDILCSYTPTIGLDGHAIRLGKIRYDVLELPGHRIFRRRWSDFFRNTAVVVFVIDLSELCDSAFYTGHLKNKTISIYEQLVQNDLLAHAGYILLFNKKDTFEDMSRGFDFKQLSANIRSSQDALSYYRTLFSAASPPKRSFHHVISLMQPANLVPTLGESLHRIFNTIRQAQLLCKL